MSSAISHPAAGATSHVALDPQDLPALFHNEYAIKVNQYHRLGVALDSKSAMFSILRNARQSKLREHALLLFYSISCAVQFACLLLRPRRNAPQRIFLFTDIRHTRLNAKGYPTFRTGLYNLRYLKTPHLYECVQKRKLIGSLVWVVGNIFPAMRSFRNRALSLGADPKVYVTCVNAGFWRILDMKILHAALSHYAPIEIAFAGHFDCYAALICHLRKTEVAFRVAGYQHGLYEVPSNELQYNPLYCDEYTLLFKESEAFFRKNLNGNSDCDLRIESRGHRQSFKKPFPRNTEDQVVVAVALQNENYDKDSILLNTVYDVVEETPWILVVYLHPLTGKRMQRTLAQQFPRAHLIRQERHANVNLLITRYSTIGIEYHRMSIPVLFVPFNDRVCVFDSLPNLVVENPSNLPQRMLRILTDRT